MAASDRDLPTARIHRRSDGRLNRAQPELADTVKRSVESIARPMAPGFHSAAHVVFGLWPLFAVIVFGAIMLWAAGFHGSP